MGFSHDPFSPCIDRAVGCADVLRPMRHQPPLHHPDMISVMGRNNDRVLGLRCDVEVGTKTQRRVYDKEPASQQIHSPQCIPTAHDTAQSCVDPYQVHPLLVRDLLHPRPGSDCHYGIICCNMTINISPRVVFRFFRFLKRKYRSFWVL